jgi:hypothetical protein
VVAPAKAGIDVPLRSRVTTGEQKEKWVILLIIMLFVVCERRARIAVTLPAIPD